jgi:signal transduction histidine kinase
MQQLERHELFHERALAVRVAFVRLLLTLANFGLIYVDTTLGTRLNGHPLSATINAAILFFAYALIAWLAVWKHWVRLDYYQIVSPLFDVGFASLLIITTGGYLSPFSLWMIFAVVGTGFSRYRTLTAATILAAMLCQILIAQIPQGMALDWSAFIVRNLFLLGVGAVIAFLGAYLSEQSKVLAILDETGTRLAKALAEEDAARVFLLQVAQLLNLSYGKVAIGEDRFFEVGGTLGPEAKHRTSWKVAVGAEVFGELTAERHSPFGRREETLLRLMCDRGASALKRIRMSADLIHIAAREERSRIADQLHDTYLQTLAALDMRAEAAKHLAPKNAKLREELDDIKKVAREAAAQAREVIQGVTKPMPMGRERIERIIKDRWTREWEVKINPDILLSDGQWRSLEMMLREGLNNAKKHGGATKVVFTVYRIGDRIIARLDDNGKGAGKVIALGYGLQRLRMVLNEQGGMLHLENAPEGGAALVAEIWTGGKTA